MHQILQFSVNFCLDQYSRKLNSGNKMRGWFYWKGGSIRDFTVNTLKITCQKLEPKETCTQPILTHQSHMINVQLEAEYLR